MLEKSTIGEKFCSGIPVTIELIGQIPITAISDTQRNYWYKLYAEMKRRSSPRCRQNFSIIEFILGRRKAVKVGQYSDFDSYFLTVFVVKLNLTSRSHLNMRCTWTKLGWHLGRQYGFIFICEMCHKLWIVVEKSSVGVKFWFWIPEIIEFISQILIADISDTKHNYWYMLYMWMKHRNSPRCRQNFSTIDFIGRGRQLNEADFRLWQWFPPVFFISSI